MTTVLTTYDSVGHGGQKEINKHITITNMNRHVIINNIYNIENNYKHLTIVRNDSIERGFQSRVYLLLIPDRLTSAM